MAITTHRVLIRPLAAQDEALFCRLFSDRQTMQFISSPVCLNRAARDFAAAVRAAKRDPLREIFFSVTEIRSGEAVGICSIQRIDAAGRRAEIGVMLQPASQGKGLGKEAILALTKTALDTLPIDEIWAQYDARNQAAAGVFISTGFQPGPRDGHDGRPGLTGTRSWCVYRRGNAPVSTRGFGEA